MALSIAASFTAVFLAIVPFRNIMLPKFDGYIPAVETLMSLGDLVTAALLFSQASVTRSKALLALAAGYLFSGLAAIPHILTFPGAFGPTGLLGGDENTSGWLVTGWRIAIPLGAFFYALFSNRYWRVERTPSTQKVILPFVVGIASLVLAFIVLAVRHSSFLPQWISGSIYSTPAYYASLAIVGVSITAMAMVWRRYSSILDLWLLLVLWAVVLELCLNFTITGRFVLGWYTLKALGSVSNLLVLFLLLTQTNTLYLRLVAQASAQEREQQRQLLVRDAIAASIAHEIRQPLSAIRLNAEAALKLPSSKRLELGVLQDILNDSCRAMDTITSTRDLYKNPAANKTPANVNRLIRDAVATIAADLRSSGVTVELTLAEVLPNAVIDRLQMQQVFLNLFLNSAEAMSVNDSPRILKVRSELRDDGLLICVQDTGPGIPVNDHDRIFGPFVTTKDAGTGLGLAICRSVVEGHGGSLRVAQHSGEGALFEIQLPCERPSVLEKNDAPRAPTDLAIDWQVAANTKAGTFGQSDPGNA